MNFFKFPRHKSLVSAQVFLPHQLLRHAVLSLP